MRRISWHVLCSALLAASSLTALAPVSHASMNRIPARRAPSVPASAKPPHGEVLAIARLIAALAPFGSVTGTVQAHGHTPVSGECVTAVPFRAAPDPDTGIPAQPEVAITDSTGGYTLTALTPGRYKIEFSSGCGGGHFATQWWDNAGSAGSARVIKVGFAAIKGIDATLRK